MCNVKYTTDQEKVLNEFNAALEEFRNKAKPVTNESLTLARIIDHLDQDLKTEFVFERYLTFHTLVYITKELKRYNESTAIVRAGGTQV